MKAIGFLCFILLINLVSAAPELTLSDSVNAGETLYGSFSGTFARTLTAEDISFYQGPKNVFVEADIVLSGDTYYLYAYPSAGNYTIKIKNILYKDPELKSITLEKSFAVLPSGNKSLSVKPGFIVTSGNAEITLFNKGEQDLNVTYEFEEKKGKVDVKKGSLSKITLKPENNFSILKIISYKNFEVPVIFIDLSVKNETIPLDYLGLIPTYLKLNLKLNEPQYRTITIINPNPVSLNLSFEKESDVLRLPNFSVIEAVQTAELNLTFLADTLGVFNSTLTIKYGNLSQPIAMEIFVFPENTTIPDTSNSGDIPSCNSLGGQICSIGQVCQGSASFAFDGYCCIGTCNSMEETDDNNGGGSSGWIIGIVIIALLGGAGFFIYKKYKKVKPTKPEDTMKKESKLYEKRITGSLTRE